MAKKLKGAAAAELSLGAGPVHPVGGGLQELHQPPGGPGPGRLDNADFAPLPGDGVGHKDGAALDVGNPLALRGVVLYDGGVDLIFIEHMGLLLKVK